MIKVRVASTFSCVLMVLMLAGGAQGALVSVNETSISTLC
jgi:hypothetical protein